MKKILSLAMVGVMMFSTLPMAYAADTQDYSLGTAVSYTADSEANREYTITVPASMEPGQSGTVTLKGKWASNETVKVTADAEVVLTNSINAADTKTLAITFAGIEKAGDNVEEKTYTENVAVAAMPADALFGTWSGKFNYNVELVGGSTSTPDHGNDEEANLISFTIDGTSYQAEEGMTWEEWVNSEYNVPNADPNITQFYVEVEYICRARNLDTPDTEYDWISESADSNDNVKKTDLIESRTYYLI